MHNTCAIIKIVIASRIPPRHFKASRLRGIEVCFFWVLCCFDVKLEGKDGPREGGKEGIKDGREAEMKEKRMEQYHAVRARGECMRSVAKKRRSMAG